MLETEKPRFAFLHLLALGAVAIAQPVFDLLGQSEAVRDSGFQMEFPLSVLPADLSTAEIRVVALSPDGHAAELHYPRPDRDGWDFKPVVKEP